MIIRGHLLATFIGMACRQVVSGIPPWAIRLRKFEQAAHQHAFCDPGGDAAEVAKRAVEAAIRNRGVWWDEPTRGA